MPTIHLVRHAEVANPNHVVYADLPGFNLSAKGVLQAHAAARRLADETVDLVLTSPLARAVQTATAIARRHDLEPVREPRLVESGQYPAWTGERWDDITKLFPGQLATYLEDATAMEDVEESIHDIASRVVAAIEDALVTGIHAIVVVGHQDPTQAARLLLTGRPLGPLRVDPPDHASVVTLVGGPPWTESAYWAPDEHP